jgi:hypothetical protein
MYVNQTDSYASSNKPTTRTERMNTFDKLPYELRCAINYCSAPVCSKKIWYMWCKEGHKASSLVEMIMRLCPEGGIQGEVIPIKNQR